MESSTEPSTDPEQRQETIEVDSITLPGRDWATHYVGNKTIFAKVAVNGPVTRLTHAVSLLENKRVEVEIMGRKVESLSKPVSSSQEVRLVIDEANRLKPCEGTDHSTRGRDCSGYCSLKALRCSACKAANQAERKKNRRKNDKVRMRKLQEKHKKKKARKIQTQKM